ncbi:MAG: nucleotide sugar dehydrogenase [Woeseiaceae bacterium]
MKIAVIGTGRVGLPLALAFAESGADVIGIDINSEIRQAVNVDKTMPFLEPGFDDVLKSGAFQIRESIEDVEDVDYFIVTVGTPLLHHIETDLTAVTRVIKDLATKIRAGQTVIMRSTTAPHTTQYVKKQLETVSGLEVGKEIFLACCPERILEGKAKEELYALPQIVGTEDGKSRELADALFQVLGVEVMHCDYITAELVKLFNNVSRYAYFAIANVLAMIAIDYKAEPYEILRLTNYKYPRPITSKPGFTAGTCLRKDFGMLSEAYWSADILVSAWRINESMPKFLVEAAKGRWGELSEFNIAVLGYSFKRDADDVRDTLSDKVLRYLHRECPRKLVLHDHLIQQDDVPVMPDLAFTSDLSDAIADADLLVIATNHSLYSEQREKIIAGVEDGSCRVVDIWDSLGTGSVLLG